MNALRVVRLQAENVKRLKAVDITPEGPVVRITGANAQGKTSVLDAIWYALGGKDAQKDTPQPIRAGQDKARVVVDLGDLVVTRTWSAKDSSLKVENKEGLRFGSPQQLLDSLVGRLSFDPLAFARMKASDQAETLRTLTGLDLSEHDARRKAVYDERTGINRDVKSLEAQLGALTAPTEALPTEEIRAKDLLQTLGEARSAAGLNRLEREKLDGMERELGDSTRRLEALEKELAAQRDRVASQRATTDAQRAKVEALSDPDVAALETQLAEVEDTNRKIRAAAQYDDVQDRLGQVKTRAAELSAELERLDAERAQRIEDAEMPVAGLAFGDGCVTFQGLPFSQASSAEQLRVSLAMAMSLNPTLRVIRITDGSLLDSESMAIVQELAEGQGYQVWVECVAEGPGVGIYISDGSVVGDQGGFNE